MTLKEEIRMLIDEEIERNPKKYDVNKIDLEFEKSASLTQFNFVIEHVMEYQGGLNALLHKTDLDFFHYGL